MNVPQGFTAGEFAEWLAGRAAPFEMPFKQRSTTCPIAQFLRECTHDSWHVRPRNAIKLSHLGRTFPGAFALPEWATKFIAQFDGELRSEGLKATADIPLTISALWANACWVATQE